MANIYETLNPSTDVTTTRTLLHEAIPLTGSIISGTYQEGDTGTNIKNYTHGMFQSVYDYPYLSSSSNHIFDITVGYSNNSSYSSSANVQNGKKINMYQECAQVALGYDLTGGIEIFEGDLNISDESNQFQEVFFLNFSRLLVKDSIKKGSFSLSLGTGSWPTPMALSDPPDVRTITDASASQTGYTAEGATGDWGLLYESPTSASAVGAVFYNLGMVVLTASVFRSSSAHMDGAGANSQFEKNNGIMYGISGSWTDLPITASADAIRRRIYNLSFNNSVEINSTIYFCRASAPKFNYSLNPTYTTGSKIRVKREATDIPRSYITTVGLYNASNQLMAVAKLSEPLTKTPSEEVTLRVRLDY
tara:strand:- start:1498 stop:2583 length:1086 start_codon:yes stop_codon:yes gene_type:complete